MNAYVTLVSSNSYIYPAIALMYSWKNTNSKYPFYAIVTNDITSENKKILKEIGYNIIEKQAFLPKAYTEMYKNASDSAKRIHGKPGGETGWANVWTKLEIFGLTQFEKVLYIDSDVLILQNLDDVFDCGHMTSTSWVKDEFLAGFLLVEPNEAVYNSIIAYADNYTHCSFKEIELPDDMIVLLDYYKNWKYNKDLHLPDYYFFDILRLTTENKSLMDYDLFKIKSLHYTADKPWMFGKKYVSHFIDKWYLFKMFWLYYIDFLNDALLDIKDKGIADLKLID